MAQLADPWATPVRSSFFMLDWIRGSHNDSGIPDASLPVSEALFLRGEELVRRLRGVSFAAVSSAAEERPAATAEPIWAGGTGSRRSMSTINLSVADSSRASGNAIRASTRRDSKNVCGASLLVALARATPQNRMPVRQIHSPPNAHLITQSIISWRD